MNRSRNSILVTAFVLVISVFAMVSSTSQADDIFGDRSKWGISADRLQNGNSGEYGVLLGFRDVGYFQNSPAYLGLEAHSGTDRGGTIGQDNLTYAGLSIGFDGNYFRTISYDFNCLLGYGFGNVGRYLQSGQSVTIQPQVALGLIMISGYRASFTASHLFMPAANGFSTWMFGIRLDRKITTTGSGLSD